MDEMGDGSDVQNIGTALKYAIPGAIEGQDIAPKTARENLTVLDAAGIGAGVGSGMAAAKGATKLAGILGKADVGLSGADALLGVGDVKQGVDEGDIPRAIMGGARIAGGTYGAASGLKTLKELGVKLPDEPTVMDEGGRGWNPFNYKTFKTVDKGLETPAGNKYTWETEDPPTAMAIKMRLEDPETNQRFGELADYINDIGKAADEDGLAGNIDIATQSQLVHPSDEVDIAMGRGDFRGFVDRGRTGRTSYGQRFHGTKDGSQPFFIAPRDIAKRTQKDFEYAVEAVDKPENIERALGDLPEEVANYARAVREGATRVPEVEAQLKGQLFARNTLYTSLHEGSGHWSVETGHRKLAGTPEYKDAVVSSDGQHQFEFFPRQVSMSDPGQRAVSLFEPAHNAAVTAIIDDTRLVKLKQKMQTPEFRAQAAKWFETALEEINVSNKVTKRADRVIGRAEAKRADEAYRALQEEPPDPTPPGSVPPGSSGGAPQGPELPSLAKRIKATLESNTRAKNQNELKKREINSLRAQALRDNEAQLASQAISVEDFHATRKKILSGDYGLINKVQEMPISEAEKMAMTQAIAQQAQDDAFLRNRGQIAFDKMIKGERLEDNEIQIIRQIIGERFKINEEDPGILKLGKFFANATGSARALMTAYDISAAGRQALYAAPMNPGAVKEAFKAQLKALRMTRPEFDSFMARLQDPMYNPFAEISEKAGLHFSETMDKASGKQEENFYNGKWAEALPGVRQSEQAYIAYLNKMRVELFNKHAKVMMDEGEEFIDASTGDVSQKLKDLAYMVNTLTGRGELSLFHMSPNSPMGKKFGLKETWVPGRDMADKAHEALTTVFFAPRFAASRAALMRDTVQALAGGGLDPAISKIYMKNVIGTITAVTSTMAMLAATGVGTFQEDPRKKDFGVLKVGNTRYDAYGGLKPWAKIVSLVGTDKYFSGQYGVPTKYGATMGSRTKKGEVGKFVQGKLSPAMGFLLEAYTGEDFMGRKSHPVKNALEHSAPMILQTIYESIEANEADQLPLAVPLSLVGVGVNSYSNARFKKGAQ